MSIDLYLLLWTACILGFSAFVAWSIQPGRNDGNKRYAEGFAAGIAQAQQANRQDARPPQHRSGRLIMATRDLTGLPKIMSIRRPELAG